MDNREEIAASRFACDDVQRACFECGIKLATIYHQYVGTPFCEKSRPSLEKAIEESIKTQPYVESAKVSIVCPGGNKKDIFEYTSLTGEMIDAKVCVSVSGKKVTGEMRYDKELKYPLMFVSSISN